MLIPANPAHIRGAGQSKPSHKIKITTGAGLDALAEELPIRYRAIVYIGAWWDCAGASSPSCGVVIWTSFLGRFTGAG